MSNAFLLDSQLADNIGAGAEALPREAILDTVPRSALAATKKIVNLVPITSNSVGANQTVQFLLPQRNLAKAHSFYLKFKLQINKDNTTNACSFSFGGSMASAAALINNVTVQAGGMILESLQNYHLWSNNVLSWAHQGQDELAIEALCSGSQSPFYVPLGIAAAGPTATIAAPKKFSQQSIGFWDTANGNASLGTQSYGANAAQNSTGTDIGQFGNQQFDLANTANSKVGAVFSIPLNVGFLNPKEAQFIPLQFINGGVLLTFQTNSIAKAFGNLTGTGSIVSYEMSDMELCYAEIQPSAEYIQRVRSSMAGGKMIKIECQSYQQYQTGNATSLRQMFNVNLTSLSACFWGRIADADATTTAKVFSTVGADADSNIRYEIYLDNQLMFQSPNQFNTIAHNIRQLQEALAATVGDYQVSPFCIGRGAKSISPATAESGRGCYTTDAALYGLSTKLFASNSCSLDGTPVGTITVNFVNSLDTGSATIWYFFMVHDYLYMVDASGTVAKLA
jgi:hypothetical protein